MFWHHKVRVFRKRGITYKKHCFYSLNGADCSKFLRMTVQQKKLLLRFIKQHRGSSEEVYICMPLIFHISNTVSVF